MNLTRQRRVSTPELGFIGTIQRHPSGACWQATNWHGVAIGSCKTAKEAVGLLKRYHPSNKERAEQKQQDEAERCVAAYPLLVEALREAEQALAYYAKHARGALNDRPQGVGAKCAALLRELGEG